MLQNLHRGRRPALGLPSFRSRRRRLVPIPTGFFNKNMIFALASERTSSSECDSRTAALAKSVDRHTDTVACQQCLYDIHVEPPSS